MKMFTDHNLVIFVSAAEAHLCRCNAHDSHDSDHMFTPKGGTDHSYACMRENKDMDSLKNLSLFARDAGARILVLRGMHGTWSSIVHQSVLPVVEVIQWRQLQSVEDCRRIYGDDYTSWDQGDTLMLSDKLSSEFPRKPYQFR
ncbi:MAG: hypothetical protein WAV09_04055 [Minisyncoccia bacterium]